jgi:hypothetical protein
MLMGYEPGSIGSTRLFFEMHWRLKSLPLRAELGLADLGTGEPDVGWVVEALPQVASGS